MSFAFLASIAIWLLAVKYIGTEQCVDCHQDQHSSYLQTTHSISASKAVPDLEPESGTYEHPLSGFRYDVEKKDGQLIHREIMRDVDGNRLATLSEKGKMSGPPNFSLRRRVTIATPETRSIWV